MASPELCPALLFRVATSSPPGLGEQICESSDGYLAPSLNSPVCHGKARILWTRIMVSVILDNISRRR
jgi:hypothetical protein